MQRLEISFGDWRHRGRRFLRRNHGGCLDPGRMESLAPRTSLCFSLTCTAKWFERSGKDNGFSALTKSSQRVVGKAGLRPVSGVRCTHPSKSLCDVLWSLWFHRMLDLPYQGKIRGSTSLEKSEWMSPPRQVVPGSWTQLFLLSTYLHSFLALFLVLHFLLVRILYLERIRKKYSIIFNSVVI